jgi:hypothetical protein
MGPVGRTEQQEGSGRAEDGTGLVTAPLLRAFVTSIEDRVSFIGRGDSERRSAARIVPTGLGKSCHPTFPTCNGHLATVTLLWGLEGHEHTTHVPFQLPPTGAHPIKTN